MLEAEVTSESTDYAEEVIEAEKGRQMKAATTGFSVMLELMPEDRGQLKQEALEPTVRGDKIVYGVGGGLPYAMAQEFGTPPYTPPIQPLLDWGERQLGSEAAGAAVWQKIREEGIDEKSFLRDSLDAAEEVLNGTDPSEVIDNQISDL